MQLFFDIADGSLSGGEQAQDRATARLGNDGECAQRTQKLRCAVKLRTRRSAVVGTARIRRVDADTPRMERAAGTPVIDS